LPRALFEMPRPKETPAVKSSNTSATAFATKMAAKAQAGRQIDKVSSRSDQNKRKRKKAEASPEASENDELDGSEVLQRQAPKSKHVFLR
jgi:hypothetical protein